ncbi:helix-hairpin-helix domain-containing protein [Streptomyces xiaopingdaonensis]|uniref:helix-hairpin-helix domain-containing protein n=1 Tax=Streptomyces xiaopingdaonensis TaxID=1565415 RepID=UPI0003118C85|nr:helix-hairpin-helix domain-containing protein [Streptomyces xiaopingdaonensis]
MTNDKAAELLAAVRAVENGERSAASFFTEPAPAARPPQQAQAPAEQAPAVRRPAAAGPALRELLAEGGAPAALAAPAAEALGEGAAEALAEDPWRLLAVPGVGPEQADTFARALLGEEAGPAEPRRSAALVGWLLERAALRGHSALAPADLSRGLAEHAVPDPEAAVREAIESGAVLAFEDSLDAGPAPRTGGAAEEAEEEEQPVRMLLGLDRYALAEESLADGLARLLATLGSPAADEPDAPRSGADWDAAASSAGPGSTAELVRAVAGSGLVVHTGGEEARREPAALVAAAAGQGLRVRAAAHSPEGRARLAALVREAPATGPAAPPDEAAYAVTVAGLLAGHEGPARDEEGRWPLDLLVLQDAQLLDAETAAAVVESLPEGARLVLSGDPMLLGAAGPGNVLGDVLASRACPHVASRTPDPGPIGELVSGVGAGEWEAVEAPGREVVIVPVAAPGEAVHRSVQLVADSVPRALGVASEDTEVIALGHGGAAGTRALNAALKQQLNPGPGRFDGFDPGDRVAYSPSPGHTSVGTVSAASEDGLVIETASGTETVPRARLAGVLRHGWAITAHQAAGVRWPAAVVVVPGDAVEALTREWVYTAFSRAETHLSVVHGAVEALPQVVADRRMPERTTRLRTLLTRSMALAAADAQS